MTNVLDIYRGEDIIYSPTIDERTMFSHTILAEHKIETTIISPSPIDFHEGDYINHGTDKFEINQPPTFIKYNNLTYVYTINFEHPIYRLYDAVMLHLGDMDFTFFGTVEDHLNLILENANRVSSGWTKGIVDPTEEKLITYGGDGNGTKCRNALTMVCEAFGMEFSYNNFVLNIVRQAGVETNIFFEYGRGKGLYELERLTPENYHPVTKLYVFGGKTNIPLDYRSGKKRLTTDSEFVSRTLESGEREREDSKIFDDIFPNRTGSVTSADSPLVFSDSSLDFDINDNLIAGTTPKVVFKTGDLNGNEFEIESYDNDTKTFALIENTEENGYILPNSTVKPSIDDQYTLIGISLPSSYITVAENNLQEAGLLLINEQNRLPYSCRIDEKYIRDNGVILHAGDRVSVRDPELGINESIRITTLSYPLCVPERYEIVISDKLLYTKIDREILDRKTEQNIIRDETNVNTELARNQALRFRQLRERVFDADGYFDPINIRPFSIETYMLTAGAKSQNFGLNDVVIRANHLGDPNTLNISAGALVHYEIEIEGVGYVWNIPTANFTLLDPNKFYYVYARCSKTVLNGTWQISETPVMTEDPLYPNFYNFNLGILYEVKDGFRNFEFTKGMTYIVGDTITTGRIKSLDGLNFFDLTSNQFKLGGTTYGIDWNVTTAGRLTIRGGIAVSPSGTIDYIPVWRGNWVSGVPYWNGDTVRASDGNTYKFVGATQGIDGGNPPTNPGYWRLSTEKGQDGIYTELRFQKNGSATVPPSVQVSNPTPPDWTLTMPSIGAGEFLWVISARKQNASTLLDNWGIPARMNGEKGSDGAAGAFISPRGEYGSLEEYFGTPELINAVQVTISPSVRRWFVSRVDAPVSPFSNVHPISSPNAGDYWNEVSATFEMIATGLLLADLAYIENLGVKYLRTAAVGQKRVEIDAINNNIRILASNNKRFVELDDDTAKALGGTAFYIEFDTSNMPSANLIATDPAKDWSQYNTGSIDSRTGLQGNWVNGFPLTYSGLYDSVSSGTRRRYYFYNGGSGVMIQDANALGDPLQPITSIGHDFAVVKNLYVSGMFGNGQARRMQFNNVEDLDAGAIPDSVILFESSENGFFTIQDIISSGIYNLAGIKNNIYGRVLEFVNLTSSYSLTVQSQSQTGMFRVGTGSVNSITVGANQTARIKLISLQDTPVFPANWRWQLISRHSNI